MILPDVNVLVYAFRPQASRHAEYRRFLLEAVNGDEAYAIANVVLSGFLRIVTHPRVFEVPDPIGDALEWIATDRDYARFPGLRWRHPLA